MAIVTPNVNIKFNSILDDVVVLSKSATKRTVVLWDNLTVADQTLLTNIINSLGGTAPLAAPVAGYSTVTFSTAITGTDATGLDSLAAASNGTASVSFLAPKTGTSASGLGAAATAGRQDVTITPAFTAGTAATGLANDTTAYTATITVDGVAKSISVVGSSAQTVAGLLTEINADLGASAVASLASGNIRVTSATTGATSTVAITDVDLFAGLTGTAVVSAAVAGTAAVNAGAIYTATVEVDGVSHKVSFTGSAGVTLAAVATEIDNDLGASASVAVVNNKLVITSSSTGPASRVRVFDTGRLFSRLTDFAGIAYADGVNPVSYHANINVDGTNVPVIITGADAQTFTDLVASVNTALGAAATAAIDGSTIVITSATTGASSSVAVSADGLFSHVAGYVSVGKVVGADDLVGALKGLRMPNGTTGWEYFPSLTVAVDRPVKPVAGSVPKDIKHIYWGGVTPDWRYFNDDSAV